MNTNFDHIDVFYLANSFNGVELRREIHKAEINTAISNTYIGTEYQLDADLFAWADYVDICKQAIEQQRQSTPKQTSITGYIDIEAIKAKNDIVTVIENYTKLRKAGENFTGCCPIHNDKHPSMTVYPDQQSWRCYGCNRGGDVIAFIEAVENTDFKGATAILGGGR